MISHIRISALINQISNLSLIFFDHELASGWQLKLRDTAKEIAAGCGIS